jgi:L-ascorbate metabolism protein UlaG (beta-lactamase superfamily)
MEHIELTPTGGPTVVIDIGGLRLLVDPTFDPPGEYSIGTRSLVKTEANAWTEAQVGRVAAVLLSHDQHPDNLDHAGRRFVDTAPLVLTTPAAASRLGANVRALSSWSGVQLRRPDDRALTVTAAPAQHGPPGTEHLTGPVTGFVLSGEDLPTVYVSGDNASLDVVREIQDRRGPVDVAVLFAGGAKSALLGDAYLTMSNAMAAEAAAILGRPRVLVVHTDGWSHFTQGADTLVTAFTKAGVLDTLEVAVPGRTIRIDLHHPPTPSQEHSHERLPSGAPRGADRARPLEERALVQRTVRRRTGDRRGHRP